jgi:AraC-like DNA-binding protein
MPPHAYQLQLRIAHAKRFLRQGRLVSETACLVGFFDQSHFVHSFKRSEGVTPSQYLRFSKNLQDGKVHTHYFECDLSR